MPFVLLAAGLGLTVDTVLLVALVERRNRTARQVWMVTLTAAAWCWHAGVGAYFLLDGAPPEAHHWRWAAMTLMVFGLLAMPCSLLHGVLRLTTTGWFGTPQRRGYEPLLYAPVLLAAPIAVSLPGPSTATFLERVDPLVLPYLGAITAISLLAAMVIWRSSGASGLPAGPRFLRTLSLSLLAMTVVLNVTMLVALPLWPEAEVLWYVILVLLPLPPALLFAYFVLRYGFLPLVLERTLVYGGILAVLGLVHRSAVAPLEATWGNQIGAKLLGLEFALGAALVIGYPPARRRVREALRYLTSGTVRQFRREVRQLSVELAAQGGSGELLAWFVPALTRIPGIAAVQIKLWESPHGLDREQCSGEPLCTADVVNRLNDELATANLQALFADQAPSRWSAEELLRARVTAVIRTDYDNLQNLWLIRAAPGGELWGDEELNALVLLAEQWVAAVKHGLLQAARSAAERRVWQAEKLSSLGLLAGSLAHEIKNPLSSMKTLATVALEESDPQSEHAESLRLILSEIDRLAQTTQQLLAYVRPGTPAGGDVPCDLADAVAATLQIAGHRARQQQVALQSAATNGTVRIRAPREALQSVLLNLVLNAIEACPPGGTVTVDVAKNVKSATLAVRDTGPGISAEMQDRLFQPLATTKADGTGLGLYSAAQTVRDLGGEIAVESAPGAGSVFRVTLPLVVDVS
jgi:signal transduction histidine kinase